MRKFVDNSVAPILAVDFDDTICIGNSYPDPHNGKLRPYTKEVINFLYSVGVKIVIWTNRKNIKGTDVKDKLLMKQWLNEMGIWYHTVNDSTEFAPFKYYGRKLYAHMFVDDRAFGFDTEDNMIMLRVLREFLIKVVGYDVDSTEWVIDNIISGREPDYVYAEEIQDIIDNWNKNVPTGTPYQLVGDNNA